MVNVLRGAAITGFLVVTLSACWSFGELPKHVQFSGYDAELMRGPDHCEWDATWVIEVKDPRFDVETDGIWVAYVRDPSVIRGTYASESDLDARLPSGASKLAGPSAGYELWFDPADETLLYVVTDERVEAWALNSRYFPCA